MRIYSLHNPKENKSPQATFSAPLAVRLALINIMEFFMLSELCCLLADVPLQWNICKHTTNLRGHQECYSSTLSYIYFLLPKLFPPNTTAIKNICIT